MKNALYHIAGFLIIVWSIAYFSFNTNQGIHFLLVIAEIFILVRIVFDKVLSGILKEKHIDINNFKT